MRFETPVACTQEHAREAQADLDAFGVTRHDLLHMDNTVQMHKEVHPERPKFESCIVKHKAFKHRLYYVKGGGNAPPVSEEIKSGLYWINRKPKFIGGAAKKVSKVPRKDSKRRR